MSPFLPLPIGDSFIIIIIIHSSILPIGAMMITQNGLTGIFRVSIPCGTSKPPTGLDRALGLPLRMAKEKGGIPKPSLNLTVSPFPSS